MERGSTESIDGIGSDAYVRFQRIGGADDSRPMSSSHLSHAADHDHARRKDRDMPNARRHTGLRRTAIGAMALVLIVAACSNSSDTKASSSSSGSGSGGSSASGDTTTHVAISGVP